MFCKNCGKEIPDGYSFCSFCGYRVNNAPKAAPQMPPQAAHKPPEGGGNGGGRKGLLIAAIAVGAAFTVAAVVVIVLLLRGRLSGTSDPYQATREVKAEITTEAETESQILTTAAPLETYTETAPEPESETEPAATAPAAQPVTQPDIQPVTEPAVQPAPEPVPQTPAVQPADPPADIPQWGDVPQNGYDVNSSAMDYSNLVYGRTVVVYIPGFHEVYTDNYMDTRGTITYGASDISCIESEDVWLLDVQEGPNGMAAHIRYRTFNDGRAEGYIPLSLISSNNGKISGYYTSGGDFQVAVEDPYTVTSDHHIAFGDSIYFISDEGGGMYCIMYNLDAGGWRIAYCRSSDFSRYAVY